jgi:dUTP pyrophosphatase
VIELRIRRLHPESDADIELPRAMSHGAAGLDVRAAAPSVLQPGQWAAIPTGLAMAVPPGVEIQVRPRSGLAFKYGVTVLNAPGTIDADYRGEVKVLLINHGSAPFAIERGMRVAQLVVAEVAAVTVVETDELDGTRRGTAGFGSTGTAG